MVLPFSVALTLKLANSCSDISIDCSCSAFLAAAGCYLVTPHTWRSNCPILLLLPLGPSHNEYPVFVEARRGLFEVKNLYSSNTLTASTDFAVPLQSAEHGTEYLSVPVVIAYTIFESAKEKIPIGTTRGKIRSNFPQL